jgi:nucleotide-binding universal stress UspA family protein
MFRDILVPYDFSEDSRYAVRCLRQIPGIRQIVLLHVLYNKHPSKGPDGFDPQVDYARLRLEEVKKDLELETVPIRTLVEDIRGGTIADAIKEVAAREGSSLIVMGRRGRSVIEALLLGSVASDMLHYGTTDLLLVHAPDPGGLASGERADILPELFSNVLIATDFSEPEVGGLCLHKIPWIQKATFVHVVTTGDSHEEVQASVDDAQKRLEAMRDAFDRHQIPAEIRVRVGSAEEAILSLAESENISLIVMKATGQRGILTSLLGSKVSYVARRTQRPILVLKQ